MATPPLSEVAFLKWFCKLLDEHDLDGDVFGEYAVALFSASSPIGKDGDLLEACSALESYLSSVTEEDVSGLVLQAASMWSGKTSLPAAPEETAPISDEADDDVEDIDDVYASWETDSDAAYDAHEVDEGAGSMDATALLSNMFPVFEPSSIADVLEVCDYDFEQAVAYLLKCYTESEDDTVRETEVALTPAAAADAQQAKESSDVSVCRHFIMGSCYRSDCWFSHDMSSIPCKFWLSGACIKGMACDFAHIAGAAQADLSAPATAGDPQAEGYVHNVEEFPSVNGQGTEQPDRAGATWLRKDISTQLKMDKLHVASTNFLPATLKARGHAIDLRYLYQLSRCCAATIFGDVPEFRIADAVDESRGDFASAKALLHKRFPNAKAKLPVAKACNKPAAGIQHSSRHRVSKDIDLESREWIETGGVIGRQYKQLRETAIEHARLRNRYFQEATQAYISNHPAAAKGLSQKGRYHHEMSARLHQEAASTIFSSRNAGAQQVLDLHGLHVKEALEVLGASLEQAAKALDHLYVITGTGHHSAAGRARLQPAVQAYLDDLDYGYADISTDRRGGMLKIRLH